MFPTFHTARPDERMGDRRRTERAASARPAPADVRSPDRGPRRSWRDKVRSAVDLTVAFVTLEGIEPYEPEVEQTSSHASVGAVHPHRKPLRPMPGPRRPGAAVRRVEVCTSPVGAHHAPAPKRRSRLT